MKARRISRQKPSRRPLSVHYRPFLGSISSLKDFAELITDYMSVIFIGSQFARNCRVLQRNRRSSSDPCLDGRTTCLDECRESLTSIRPTNAVQPPPNMTADVPKESTTRPPNT